MKPTPKIESNLKKRKLVDTGGRSEECEFAFMTLRDGSIIRRWFMDSCASRHLTNQREKMFDYRPLKDVEFVNAANEGSAVKVVGIGNLKVKQVINGAENVMVLKDVGYAPKCRTNLVSLAKAQRAGVEFTFKGGGTKMEGTYKGRVVLQGDSQERGISELLNMVPVTIGKPDVSFFNAGEDDAMNLAHRRTCHTAVDTLRRMESTNAVQGLNIVKSTKGVGNVCEACVDGKATNKGHARREKSTSKVLELMHTDLCGPIDPPGINGEKYAQLLVDDYSGAIWVSSMSLKSGAAKATKAIVLHAQKLTGQKLITLRPDGAKEFKEGGTKKFLDENNTVLDEIPPYSPESNGRVERQNRTVFEKARTILSELNMMCTFESYKKLWPEAVRTVVYVRNRTLTKSTHRDVRDKTPYEVITGKKPDLSHLRIFGTRVKVLKPQSYRKSKVEPKVWDGVHVGYNDGGSYRAYVPALGRVFVSRDVTFIEKLYRFPQQVSFEVGESRITNDVQGTDDKSGGSDENDEDYHSADEVPDNGGTTNTRLPWISGEYEQESDDDKLTSDGQTTNEVQPVKRRSSRVPKKPNRYSDMGSLAFLTAETLCGSTDESEPSSPESATSGPNKKKWVASMADEMESMMHNRVFDVVSKPDGRKSVACRWVYALKRNSSGKVVRYKSRLVAKGFSQVKGVDYDEVFAPVVRYETLRFLLAHVARHDLELQQVDVKTAFLYGKLNEEIFMDMPTLPEEMMIELLKRFSTGDSNHKRYTKQLRSLKMGGGQNLVLKLRKSIYGLRQAAMEWHRTLKKTLHEFGMTQSTSDPCLFIVENTEGKRCFVRRRYYHRSRIETRMSSGGYDVEGEIHIKHDGRR